MSIQGSPPPTQSLTVIHRLVQIYKLWHGMLPYIPKTERYTLGGKIDALFVRILECMITASYLPPKEKIPFLQKAVTTLDLLKFFLQLIWEVKGLDTTKYVMLSEPLDEVGKMLGGWYKKMLPKETPPP